MDTILEKDSGSSSGLSLAERLRDGSPAAWSDLVRLYGPLVDRWCRTSNVPTHTIPDIAQEVFLAAFRGIERFDGRRGERNVPWLAVDGDIVRGS